MPFLDWMNCGEVSAATFRDERQMVCILNPGRRQAVLDYLARKRA